MRPFRFLPVRSLLVQRTRCADQRKDVGSSRFKVGEAVFRPGRERDWTRIFHDHSSPRAELPDQVAGVVVHGHHHARTGSRSPYGAFCLAHIPFDFGCTSSMVLALSRGRYGRCPGQRD